MTDPFMTVVVLAVAALAALIAVSIVWLTARAIWEAHVARARNRFWNHLGHQLVHVTGDPIAEAAWLEAARAYPADVLQHSLGACLMRTSGAYKEQVAALYRALGLLDGDLVAIRSRRWSVRMNALRRLAAVVTSEHRADILALAREGGEVRLLVAQIIGRIGTAEDVLPLLCSWSLTSRLSEYPLHVMLDALDAPALRTLVAHWSELASPTLQRILLDAASRKAPAACYAILPLAARHRSLEVRIAAAHACGVLTSAETAALLSDLVGDAAWEVRAQAVKALAHVFDAQLDATLDLLTAALADPNFWVRQNAAASLGHHGARGLQRLRRVLANASDRYARDAAEHVLADLACSRMAAT